MANEKDANVEFSSYEIDAVGEILNISMGSAATAVSELLNAKVWITTPQVSVVKAADLNYDRLEPAICVKIVYVSGISGQNMMVLKQDDVQLILNQLMGNPLVVSPDFEFDEMNISAVSEVMNQMMGASATALSDLLGISVDISTPTPYLIEQTNFCQLAELDPDETIVAVTFNLSVDGVMNSEFMSVMSVDLAKSLSDKMIEKFHGDEAEAQPTSSLRPLRRLSLLQQLRSLRPLRHPSRRLPRLSLIPPRVWLRRSSPLQALTLTRRRVSLLTPDTDIRISMRLTELIRRLFRRSISRMRSYTSLTQWISVCLRISRITSSC